MGFSSISWLLLNKSRRLSRLLDEPKSASGLRNLKQWPWMIITIIPKGLSNISFTHKLSSRRVATLRSSLGQNGEKRKLYHWLFVCIVPPPIMLLYVSLTVWIDKINQVNTLVSCSRPILDSRLIRLSSTLNEYWTTFSFLACLSFPRLRCGLFSASFTHLSDEKHFKMADCNNNTYR